MKFKSSIFHSTSVSSCTILRFLLQLWTFHLFKYSMRVEMAKAFKHFISENFTAVKNWNFFTERKNMKNFEFNVWFKLKRNERRQAEKENISCLRWNFQRKLKNQKIPAFSSNLIYINSYESEKSHKLQSNVNSYFGLLHNVRFHISNDIMLCSVQYILCCNIRIAECWASLEHREEVRRLWKLFQLFRSLSWVSNVSLNGNIVSRVWK